MTSEINIVSCYCGQGLPHFGFIEGGGGLGSGDPLGHRPYASGVKGRLGPCYYRNWLAFLV